MAILQHFVKVFVYAGVSALGPAIAAYLQNEPQYLLLIPVINALLAAFTKFLKAKGFAPAEKYL